MHLLFIGDLDLPRSFLGHEHVLAGAQVIEVSIHLLAEVSELYGRLCGDLVN